MNGKESGNFNYLHVTELVFSMYHVIVERIYRDIIESYMAHERRLKKQIAEERQNNLDVSILSKTK